MRFGTDGLRGPAPGVLTPDLAARLGYAVATVFGADRVVMGRDTRESGPALRDGVARGCAAASAAVEDLGVAPTPAVAYAAQVLDVPGVVVSASHNPWPDNGLKVFAPGGTKLSERRQADIEAALGADPPSTAGADRRLRDAPDLVDGWADHVVGSAGGRRLDGLDIVVDAGHGAASAHAGAVLGRLGASVTVINAGPDGRNINDGCGSTDLAPVAREVTSRGADLGLALDGDADRVLAVDHTGREIDGDAMITICALDRRARSLPGSDGVVVTVMANLGLRRAMAAAGIRVVETPVGDRHVLAALAETGLTLGGEQSGHIVFADLATTGDGLLTGVQVADLVNRSGRRLADIVDSSFTRLPQVLVSVPVEGDAAAVVDTVAADVRRVAEELGSDGRVLVRPSGTEPVVRVMAEADTDTRARAAVERIVAALDGSRRDP